jgi:hypothetical protein
MGSVGYANVAGAGNAIIGGAVASAGVALVKAFPSSAGDIHSAGVGSMTGVTPGTGAAAAIVSALGKMMGVGSQIGGGVTNTSVIAINSSGKLTLNGVAFMPRGSNTPYDSQITGGYWGLNSFGICAGKGGFSVPQMVANKFNTVRITMNVAAWFNLGCGILVGTQNNPAWLSCTVTAAATNSTTLTVSVATTQMTGKLITDLTTPSGIASATKATYLNANQLTTSQPVTVAIGDVINFTAASDTSGSYKQDFFNYVDELIMAGFLVNIDSHWCAPQFTYGGITNWQAAYNQSSGPDYESVGPFWYAGTGAGPADALGNTTTGLVQSLINRYGLSSMGLFTFEIFNEPWLDNSNATYTLHDQVTTTTYDVVMKGGGYASMWFNQGGVSGLGTGIPYQYIGAINAITGGSGYANGTYANVAVTSTGVGTGATANITVSGGAVTAMTFPQFGQGNSTGYKSGDTISVAASSIGGAGSGFSTTINFMGGDYWLNSSFRVLGYQEAVNGIRALGATNVIICNPGTFSSRQSTANLIYPTDTLSPPQIAVGWHCYEQGTTGYPAVGIGESGGGTSAAFNYALATVNGTGGIGHAVPVMATEYAPTNGSGTASVDSGYDGHIQGLFDGNSTGSFGSWTWLYGGPLEPYGATGTFNQVEVILGAPITVTASITGNVMTVTSGSGLIAGMVLSSSVASNSAGGGNPDRIVIEAQLGGTPGGAGTYEINEALSIALETMYAQQWLPIQGHGLRYETWTVNHA